MLCLAVLSFVSCPLQNLLPSVLSLVTSFISNGGSSGADRKSSLSSVPAIENRTEWPEARVTAAYLTCHPPILNLLFLKLHKSSSLYSDGGSSRGYKLGSLSSAPAIENSTAGPQERVAAAYLTCSSPILKL